MNIKQLVGTLNTIFKSEDINIKLNQSDYDGALLENIPRTEILRWGERELTNAAVEVGGILQPRKASRDGWEMNSNSATHFFIASASRKMFVPFLNEEIAGEYTLTFPFKMYEANLDLLLDFLPEGYYSPERIEFLKKSFTEGMTRNMNMSVKTTGNRIMFASKDFVSPIEEKRFFLENRYITFAEDYLVILKHKGEMSYTLLFIPKPATTDELAVFDGIFLEEIKGTAFPIHEIMKKTNGRNLLVFGAPGTGKSHWVKQTFEENTESYRVTFHEEYMYQDFVGSLKPSVDEKGLITYKFKPGPFTEILAKAFKNPTTSYTLIIEELNRANAASVFGDLFQLLDRDELGGSVYSIENEDILKYLRDVNQLSEVNKITIPGNLNIIATMNSADQGVFALDTAFKRRWTFKYLPITFEKWHEELLVPYIKVSEQTYKLTVKQFIEILNDFLARNEYLEINEDRLIGPYFVTKSQWESWVDGEYFQKILNYLWDDVARIERSQVFLEGYTQFSQVCNDFKSLKQVFTDDLHHLLMTEARQYREE
ncbi:McrB family protein [Psychrobacillus soli]|uniref:ATPase dynein-related AAA domain-containing protein n=1 Tax=Psychrobacillus soli TaxID=1543965 RepID=A0A544T2H6_9BACI|nr:AAA family ATPase [Psychrobacillus soli]TQR11647.1 hypothetical protein FG383_14030 [Psychrobacillus soli]